MLRLRITSNYYSLPVIFAVFGVINFKKILQIIFLCDCPLLSLRKDYKMVKECAFCKQEFEAKTLSRVFCTPKCRTYYNRNEKRPLNKESVYIVANGVKQLVTKELLLGILHRYDAAKDFIKKINIPKELEKALEFRDYQVLLNNCELTSEYESLLELIESDTEMPERSKNIWRARIAKK